MFVFYTIQQFPASNLYIKVIHLLHVKTKHVHREIACKQGVFLNIVSNALLDVYDNYINWNVSLP